MLRARLAANQDVLGLHVITASDAARGGHVAVRPSPSPSSEILTTARVARFVLPAVREAVALGVILVVAAVREAVALGVIGVEGVVMLSHGVSLSVSRSLNQRLRSASLVTRVASVVWLTPELSSCRHLRAGESAQRGRLFHGDGPVMHLDPTAPLETAQRRVNALPGTPGLMRQFLLTHPESDDAIVSCGLAEQDLSDPTRQVKEDQVGGGIGQAAEGGRNGVREGLGRRWHARADIPHRVARDQQQLAILQGLGVGGSRAAINDADFTC